MELFHAFEEIPPGTARVFCSRDLAALIEYVEHSPFPDGFRSRIVGRVWTTIPSREAFLDDLLDLLADTVLATYPGWQSDDAALDFAVHDKAAALSGNAVVEPRASARAKIGILPEWFEAAVAQCEAAKSPILPKFDREVQIGQLARVLRADRLILLVAFEPDSVEESEGKVLSDLLRWLAGLTGLRIGVLFPESVLRATQSLEGISYGAVRFEVDTARDAARDGGVCGAPAIQVEPDSSSRPDGSDAQTTGTDAIGTDATGIDTDRTGTTEKQTATRLAAPIIGVPHPFSPAERELARLLEADAQLRGLFRYNWPVVTRRGTRHIVDLLWEDGGLILEVDGYSTHSGRRGFKNDRIRDRELLMTGFRVVRMTHDEVMGDPIRMIALVRELVRFCRDHSLRAGQNST